MNEAERCDRISLMHRRRVPAVSAASRPRSRTGRDAAGKDAFIAVLSGDAADVGLQRRRCRRAPPAAPRPVPWCRVAYLHFARPAEAPEGVRDRTRPSRLAARWRALHRRVQQRHGMFVKQPPGLGQPHGAGIAVNSSADFLLQLPDLPAERRLRHVEQLPPRAGLGDGTVQLVLDISAGVSIATETPGGGRIWAVGKGSGLWRP
jgi:hypothetical protein